MNDKTIQIVKELRTTIFADMNARCFKLWDNPEEKSFDKVVEEVVSRAAQLFHSHADTEKLPMGGIHFITHGWLPIPWSEKHVGVSKPLPDFGHEDHVAFKLEPGMGLEIQIVSEQLHTEQLAEMSRPCNREKSVPGRWILLDSFLTKLADSVSPFYKDEKLTQDVLKSISKVPGFQSAVKSLRVAMGRESLSADEATRCLLQTFQETLRILNNQKAIMPWTHSFLWRFGRGALVVATRNPEEDSYYTILAHDPSIARILLRSLSSWWSVFSSVFDGTMEKLRCKLPGNTGDMLYKELTRFLNGMLKIETALEVAEATDGTEKVKCPGVNVLDSGHPCAWGIEERQSLKNNPTEIEKVLVGSLRVDDASGLDFLYGDGAKNFLKLERFLSGVVACLSAQLQDDGQEGLPSKVRLDVWPAIHLGHFFETINPVRHVEVDVNLLRYGQRDLYAPNSPFRNFFRRHRDSIKTISKTSGLTMYLRSEQVGPSVFLAETAAYLTAKLLNSDQSVRVLDIFSGSYSTPIAVLTRLKEEQELMKKAQRHLRIHCLDLNHKALGMENLSEVPWLQPDDIDIFEYLEDGFSDPRLCILGRNWNLVVSDPHHFQTIQFLGTRVSVPSSEKQKPNKVLELSEFLSRYTTCWLLYFGHSAMRGLAHFVSARIGENWDQVHRIQVASEQLVLAIQNSSPLASQIEDLTKELMDFFTINYNLANLVKWSNVDD